MGVHAQLDRIGFNLHHAPWDIDTPAPLSSPRSPPEWDLRRGRPHELPQQYIAGTLQICSGWDRCLPSPTPPILSAEDATLLISCGAHSTRQFRMHIRGRGTSQHAHAFLRCVPHTAGRRTAVRERAPALVKQGMGHKGCEPGRQASVASAESSSAAPNRQRSTNFLSGPCDPPPPKAPNQRVHSFGCPPPTHTHGAGTALSSRAGGFQGPGRPWARLWGWGVTGTGVPHPLQPCSTTVPGVWTA